MEYVTGMQALNLTCGLDTDGDWHRSAIGWDRLDTKNTDSAFFGGYGIYMQDHVPMHKGRLPVADHVRALLDLLYDRKFPLAQGMRKDFIGNEKYTDEVFRKVYEMRTLPWWGDIDGFMRKEYRLDWLAFLEGCEGDGEMACGTR